MASSPGALKNDQYISALVDQLDKENQFRDTTLRELHGTKSLSDKLGEGYSEYYSSLLGIVADHANLSDKHVLSVLARSSYNADSPFARKLASKGEAIVPDLMSKAHSDLALRRAEAIDMFVTVVKLNSIPSATREEIRRTLLAETNDKAMIARLEAVKALGTLGKESDLPLLEHIAHTAKYPAREAASEAIRHIKSKSSN